MGTVVVDGAVRDDLLGAEGFELPIEGAAHKVMVTFVEDDPDAPSDSERDVFRIATKGDEGVSFITPTANALKGSSSEVRWAIASGYRLAEVLVDGQPYAADLSLAFNDIAADHSVEVRTSRDLYTITTVGHGPGSISDTQVVKAGADVDTTWQPQADSAVIRVVVDGVLVYDKAAQELDRVPGDDPVPAPLQKLFSDVRADHVVEVTFQPDSDGPGPSDPDDPSDSMLSLATSIVGGAGSITPSATVSAGGERTVSWNVADGYFIDRVVVTRNGERRVLDPSEYTSGGVFSFKLDNIQSNCQVQVVLTAEEKARDDLYSIATSIYGGPGTITASMDNLEAHSSDHVVAWSAPDGWRVASVQVDGVPRDDLLVGTQVVFDDITENHSVVVSVQPTKTFEVTGYYSIDVTCEGGGSAGKSASVAYGGSHTVTWRPDDGERVLRVQVDGIDRPDLTQQGSGASVAFRTRAVQAREAAGSFLFENVMADHKIHVVFSTGGPDAADRFTVSTSISGGSGTISEAVTVDAGDSHKVTWTVGEGSEVAAVYVDGNLVATPTDNSVTFDDIDADHQVRVVLRSQPPEFLPSDPPAGYYQITVEGSGNGEVSPSAHVPSGGSYQVTWVGEGGKSPVMVYVDGVERPDLLGEDGVTLSDVDGPHHVYVQFEGGRPYDPDDPDDPDDPGDPDDPSKPGDSDDPNGSGGAGDVNDPNGSGGENGSGDNGGSSGADDPNGSGGSEGSGGSAGAQGGGGSQDGAGTKGSGTDAADSKANGHRMVALGRTGDNAALPWTVAMVAAGSLVVMLLALRNRPRPKHRR